MSPFRMMLSHTCFSAPFPPWRGGSADPEVGVFPPAPRVGEQRRPSFPPPVWIPGPYDGPTPGPAGRARRPHARYATTPPSYDPPDESSTGPTSREPGTPSFTPPGCVRGPYDGSADRNWPIPGPAGRPRHARCATTPPSHPPDHDSTCPKTRNTVVSAPGLGPRTLSWVRSPERADSWSGMAAGLLQAP
jgi:hypothetical protein